MGTPNRQETQPPRISLIFIHGRRDSDPEGEWLETLETAVRRTGEGSLAELGYTVISPDWLKTLNSRDDSFFPAPKPSPSRDNDYEKSRRAYEKASNSLRDYMETQGLKNLPPGSFERIPARFRDAAADAAVRVSMRDVHTYLREESLRYRCLETVLRSLPTEGDAVIIAHSLGSVLLADLIYLLPPKLRIQMLVTIGSPLALPLLNSHSQAITDQFPFDRVGPWINLAGRGDPVSPSGISQAFPDVIDVYVETTWDGNHGLRNRHRPRTYLGQEHVASALVWLARRMAAQGYERNIESRAPDDLTAVFAGFQYALRFEQALKNGGERQKFGNWRRRNAQDAAAKLHAEAHSANEVTADDLLRDNQSVLSGFDTSDRLRLLILLAVSEPITQEVVQDPDEPRRQALAEVAVDLGGLEPWGVAIDKSVSAATAAHFSDSAFKRDLKTRAGMVVIDRGPMILWGWGFRQVMEASEEGRTGPLFDNLAAARPEVLMPLGPPETETSERLNPEWLANAHPEDLAQTVLLLHAFVLACQALDHPSGLRQALDTLLVIRERLESLPADVEGERSKSIERKLESVTTALRDPLIKRSHRAHAAAAAERQAN